MSPVTGVVYTSSRTAFASSRLAIVLDSCGLASSCAASLSYLWALDFSLSRVSRVCEGLSEGAYLRPVTTYIEACDLLLQLRKSAANILHLFLNALIVDVGLLQSLF